MNKETRKFTDVIKKRRSHEKRMRARKMGAKKRWVEVKKPAVKKATKSTSWYQKVWMWLTRWS